MPTKRQPPQPPPPPPEPPAHLSAYSQELWRQVIYRCRSQGRRAMLLAALEARDRAQAARIAIDEKGMTTETKTTGAVHIHPLLRVESQSLALFGKLWYQLALHWDGRIDGRADDITW